MPSVRTEYVASVQVAAVELLLPVELHRYSTVVAAADLVAPCAQEEAVVGVEVLGSPHPVVDAAVAAAGEVVAKLVAGNPEVDNLAAAYSQEFAVNSGRVDYLPESNVLRWHV